jgi:hypothetical protein
MSTLSQDPDIVQQEEADPNDVLSDHQSEDYEAEFIREAPKKGEIWVAGEKRILKSFLKKYRDCLRVKKKILIKKTITPAIKDFWGNYFIEKALKKNKIRKKQWKKKKDVCMLSG